MSYSVRYSNGNESGGGYQPGYSRYSASSYRTELGSTPNLLGSAASKPYQSGFVTTPIFPSAGPMANQRQYKTSTQYHSEQRYVSNSGGPQANLANLTRPSNLHFQRPPPLPGFLRNSMAPQGQFQRSATPLIPQGNTTPTAPKTPGSGRTTPTFIDPLAGYNIPKPFDQGLLALGADLNGKRAAGMIIPTMEERPRGSSQPPPNFIPQQFRVTPFQPGMNRYQPEPQLQQQTTGSHRTTTVRVIPVMTAGDQYSIPMQIQRGPIEQQNQMRGEQYVIPVQIQRNEQLQREKQQFFDETSRYNDVVNVPIQRDQVEQQQPRGEHVVPIQIQRGFEQQRKVDNDAAVNIPIQIETNFEPPAAADLQMFYSPKAQWFTTDSEPQPTAVEPAEVEQPIYQQRIQPEFESRQQRQSSLPAEFRSHNYASEPSEVRQIVDERMRQAEAIESSAPFSSAQPYMPKRSAPAFYKTPVVDNVKLSSRPVPIYSLPNDIKSVPIESVVEVVEKPKEKVVEEKEKPQTFGEKQQVINSFLKDMVLPPSFLPPKNKPTETVSKAEPKAVELPKETVVTEQISQDSTATGEVPANVKGFDQLLDGSFAEFVTLSGKIGGDLSEIVKEVVEAFGCQRRFILKAAGMAKPNESELTSLLQPIIDRMVAVQNYREAHRTSPLFNHLSAVSEAIAALGWVTVEKTPAPFVKETIDAAQFFTNRVLKDYKDKDATHVDWAKSWIKTLTELQQYVKLSHTTGLVWNSNPGCSSGSMPTVSPSKSAGPPPPPPGPPPPPPPPPLVQHQTESDGSADSRTALFAEINKGEAITSGLKKVTSDMQTHKNPSLKTTGGPPPIPKKPMSLGGPESQTAAAKTVPAAPLKPGDKPPHKALEAGKKWVVEYFKNDRNVVVEVENMKQSVYIYKCEGTTVTVKGKVNSIAIDSCKKVGVVFDNILSVVEVVNSQGVQIQTMGAMPIITIDKTDGCQVYLSRESLNAEIVTSKISEVNILVPDASGDFKECPLPEQNKTIWNGKRLETVAVEVGS